MKVVHVNGYFASSMMYQENYLLQGLSELGHDAVLITSRFEPEFEFNRDTRIKGIGIENYFDSKVYRVDEVFEIKNALVFFKPFLGILKEEKPDIIFFHGVSPNIMYGLLYKVINPTVRLHIDFHTTYSNSGGSKFSKLFHMVNRIICKVFGRYFERMFCVAPECKSFAHNEYKLPNEKLIILPLPGVKYSDDVYLEKRRRFRENSKISESDIVYCHIGKMPEDKETELVLKAFSQIKDDSIKLFIAGSAESSFEKIIKSYVEKDSRIVYLGWLNQTDISELLCGSDIMVQPGSLSQIFVDAICARLPLILDDTPQGNYLLNHNNGIISRRDLKQVQSAMEQMLDFEQRNAFKEGATIASEYYDYRSISQQSLM